MRYTPSVMSSSASRLILVAMVVAPSSGILACEGRDPAAARLVAKAAVIDPRICDSFVSPHLETKYFPGLARYTKSTKITSDVVECDIRYGVSARDDNPAVPAPRVQILCGVKVNDDAALGLARQQYATLGVQIPDIGRLAYAFGEADFQFWDDDSQCSVRIHAVELGGQGRLPGMARELAKELGPHAKSL